MSTSIELTAAQLSNLDQLIGERQAGTSNTCTESLENIAETLETLEGGEGLRAARKAILKAFNESLNYVPIEHLIEIRKHAIAKK